MADVQTYDEIIDLISDGFGAGPYPIKNYNRANGGNTLSGTAVTSGANHIGTITLPTLPSGVTKYRPTFIATIGTTAVPLMIAKLIDMGSLDISSNAFTTGSSYPSRRELGTNSVQTSGLLYVKATTTTGGTPGTLNINYTDQDGNAGTVSPTMNTGSNVGSFAMLASGDSGVQSITNTTNRSGGSSPTGVIGFYGVLPLAITMGSPVTSNIGVNVLTTNFCFPELGAGDTIVVIKIGNTPSSNSSELGYLWIVGER